MTVFERALSTEGFFSENEADFLIETIKILPTNANILEIGSYYGRSTLFMLSEMNLQQRLVSLDTFTKLAGYANSTHSFWKLYNHTRDKRHIILPLDVIDAYQHLKDEAFDLMFIDGNHSFIGAIKDIAYSILLGKLDSILLCHDVSELFPGVVYALNSFIGNGILKPVKQVDTLASYRICQKPEWIINPSVFRGASK